MLVQFVLCLHVHVPAFVCVRTMCAHACCVCVRVRVTESDPAHGGATAVMIVQTFHLLCIQGGFTLCVTHCAHAQVVHGVVQSTQHP